MNRSVLGVQANRYFSAKAPEPEQPGPASGRRTAFPGFYNRRFTPSQGADGQYVHYDAPIQPASPTPFRTQRNPNNFAYSSNILKGDYMEWRTRAADYLYQIGVRIHRSNDGWTRLLTGYTGFCFLMCSQAFIWKFHLAFSAAVLVTRIRDRGNEPRADEINILDTVFTNEKLSELFSPTTYHVIDYDQEFDSGFNSELFPEYDSTMARFFNVDNNTTTGMYKFGDVESGATMTLDFKTMPYSNTKYEFTEPFLIYDMKAHVQHNGKVWTEHIIKQEEVLKTKEIYVLWH